ncbi:hypothetical protein [Actibacterium ureilyticum]|uniref:hypothetical protein n=1 Tax=Actibacterium ureilyticum TaxID=1590614 RepID=UPI000BAB02DB|nr:hypothetical protein [Actibacterium ureilyticum]
MIAQSDIQGHWVRDWIKAPGFQDHDTRVHWIQVGADYADIRIPADRPDLRDAGALADLPASALTVLARAQGFAGRITLQGAHCTWQREINWHGTPDAPDVGAISFDAQGRMIEAGVHEDYTERWVRHTAPDPRYLRFAGHGYTGRVASIGETAVIGIGRIGKPATAPLIAALARGDIPDGIDTLFDGLHALGHWSGDSLIADLATQPFAEGTPVLTVQGDAVIWHEIGFDGTRRDLLLNPDPVPA